MLCLFFGAVAILGLLALANQLNSTSHFQVYEIVYLMLLSATLLSFIALHQKPLWTKKLCLFHVIISMIALTIGGCTAPINLMVYKILWLSPLPPLTVFIFGSFKGSLLILAGINISTVVIISYLFSNQIMIKEQQELLWSLGFINIFSLFLCCISSFLYHMVAGIVKKLESKNKKLHFSEAKLQQAIKWAAIGEMADGVAHEINNPLMINAVNISLLKKKYIADKYLVNRLDKINLSNERIATTIETLSQINSDSANNLADTHELSKIIETTLNLCQNSFKLLGIFIQVSHRIEGIVYCQLNEVVEALVSVLRNSRDAIKEQPNRVINISTTESENELLIRVSDSGEGVPEQFADQVFEPFYTTSDRQTISAGLGLTIAKTNIEKNYGKIRLLTGRPTTFEISFPKIKSSGDIERMDDNNQQTSQKSNPNIDVA